MKREGRQHGVVRCYPILPTPLSRQRYVKMVDSASATGLFTKVSKKPTNQSKFTGKCGRARCSGCHIHPACKSKDKAKGTMKLRPLHVEHGLTKYPAGKSATGVLAYLADEGGYSDDEFDYEATVNENYNYDHPYAYGYDDHDHDDGTHDIDLHVGFGIGIGLAASVAGEELENGVAVGEIDDEDDKEEDDDDDDDGMSFCDVGLCWGHEDGDEYGDDGWYLVGGQMQ